MERDGSEQPHRGNDPAAAAQSDRARELTERILLLEAEREQAEEEGDQAAQASALRKLGDLNQAAGANDAAREAYSRARYLYQMVGNAEAAATLLISLGNMEARLRRHDAAARYFRDAGDLYKRMIVPERQADALLSEADALCAAGKTPAALERIDGAAAIFAELGDTLGQAHTAFRLGMIALKEEPDRADEHLELAGRLYGDHVGRSGDDIDVTLPPTIGDSRRYPPFVMQRVCMRERQKLAGDVAVSPIPKRAPSATTRLSRNQPVQRATAKESSLTTWIGVALLFFGTLALLIPQLTSEVEVFGKLAGWLDGLVGDGTLVNVAMGLLGAVGAIVGVRQMGIGAPVVLLGVGIGVGMITHELSRSLMATVNPGARTSNTVAAGAAQQQEAMRTGRAAAAKVLGAGRSALERGELGTARSMYSESFKLASEVLDTGGKIRALEAMLALELEFGTLEEQVEAAEALYDELRGINEDRGREVLELIVSSATRLGDVARLRDAQLRLLAYFEKVGDQQGEIGALMALAAIDRDKLDLESAYEWYRRAHAGYQSTRDIAGQVGTLLAMGEIDARLGRRRRAYGSYYHAFAMYREAGDEAGQAAMLLHMGTLDEAGERYEEAIAAFRQAQRIYQSIGDDAGEAQAALRFGTAQVAHGNQRQGREGLTRSVELFEKLGDIGGQARARFGLGNHWLKLGERDEALLNYQQARRLYSLEDDPRGELAALREIALMAYRGGSEGAAEGSLREARRVTRRVADPSVRASLLLTAGDLAMSLERQNDAVATYQEALSLYRDIGDDPGQREASERLSRARAAS
jgi:tetratricopeptide (TPR) repeat protein